MKLFGQAVGAMYMWAIALLSLLVIISSYSLHVFPFSLALAVILGAAMEMAMQGFYLKRKQRIPFSGIITGLIVGSIAPINAPALLIVIAVAIAITSKFLIKFKSSNIFNPASLGLIAALAIFGLGDEWWVASNYNVYGVAISLTPLLIILAYESHRLATALSFVATSLLISIALGMLTSLTPTGIVSLAFGINYYFAFVMLVEPKTSPNSTYAQVSYGASIAMLYIVLLLLRIPYPLLAVLLLGNLGYLLYRRYAA